MKIAVAQLNYHIGHFEKNLNQIIEAIDQAKASNADLILFGELATCGYPPRDFLEFNDFIEKSNESLDIIRQHADDIAVVVGAPTINPVPEGKDLFNSAYFFYQKTLQHVQHKALLPTYDVFDEYRYFEPGSDFQTVSFKGKQIALTICEDIWNIDNTNPLYTFSPLDQYEAGSFDLILNLSASPFAQEHTLERRQIVQANAARYNTPVFYANHVGAQTELIFDGGSLVANSSGVIVDEQTFFEPSMAFYEWNDIETQTASNVNPIDEMELIRQALVTGIRDYFAKLGLKQAILGLSGGIDSALVTALATQALGKENVLAVLMPSEYSSDHSISDSVELVNNLGINHQIIPITPVYHALLEQLKPSFGNLPFSIAEENLQSRSRGVLLMGISNKLGHILLNTSNKSELAVGYGTLYGDMCGGLSVIGDLYKTEVFDLCRHLNKSGHVIPENIITKPPSAELRPDQKDSDSLPDYDILDTILKEYIENRKGPEEIIQLGYDPTLVRRILGLVNRNEFKRYQTAPVLRVSSKAFGMGRRLPIVAKYLN